MIARSTFPADRGLRPVAAFVRRDWLTLRSYRLAFVLDTFYGVLELAVFFFISRAIGSDAFSDLDGAPSYFAFAAVGIVMGLVVESASDGLAHRIRDEQLTGTLELLLAQPLSAFELCRGLAAFPFVFALVRATAYLAIAGVAMGLDVSRTDWIGLAVMFVLSALALASIGILAGAVVLVVKRGEVLASISLFAMTLLSGSVFPVSALPGTLEAVGSVLPLRFAFDGVREALFLGAGWGPDALALVAFALVGLPLAVLAFRRALTIARDAGTLAQY